MKKFLLITFILCNIVYANSIVSIGDGDIEQTFGENGIETKVNGIIINKDNCKKTKKTPKNYHTYMEIDGEKFYVDKNNCFYK